MMFKFVVVLSVIAAAFGFIPTKMIARSSDVQMSLIDLQSKFSKAVGIAAVGIALAGPMIPNAAIADGAVSQSTVFRARTNYGAKILDLSEVQKHQTKNYNKKSTALIKNSLKKMNFRL
jgi:hypothetical protein